MTIVILTGAILYSLFVIGLILLWRSIPEAGINNVGTIEHISIVVPVRNEISGIKDLLDGIEKQTYPKAAFEVIIVDDHSDDNTISYVSDLKSDYSFEIKTLSLNAETGKKYAIEKGIAAARGDIIVTTDGDCVIPSRWLEQINSHFINEDQVLLFGPVTFKENGSLFSQLQVIEFASLIGTGAATMALGFPGMGNGANLAYKKSAFLEVRGYDGNREIPSGDDEFLLQKMHDKFKGRVKFLKSKDAVVTTDHQSNLRALFQQRVRWASKWRYHPWYVKLLALFIFTFHLLMFTGVILSILGVVDMIWMLVILAWKCLIEFWYLSGIVTFLNRKVKIVPFLFLQIFYPFYAITIGIMSNTNRYMWKGRLILNGKQSKL
ncbi:MAG: glycosyltransferase [Bacteroidota bacterium]